MADTTNQTSGDEKNDEKTQSTDEDEDEYDIPEYVDTTLLPHTVKEDSNPTHSDKAILEMIHTAPTPFISTTALTDMAYISKQQVNDKLKKLTEVGILKSAPAGDSKVYWLNHPDSEHPVPNDVKQYLPTDEDSNNETEIDNLLTASYYTLLIGSVFTLIKFLSTINTGALTVEANYGMLPITIVLLGVLLFIHTKIAMITNNEEYSVLPESINVFDTSGDADG